MSGNVEMLYFKEAVATLKATGWQLFKARLFGKKFVSHGPDGTVIFLRHRGISYLIDYIPAATTAAKENGNG